LHPGDTWEKVTGRFPRALVAPPAAIVPKVAINESEQEIGMSPASRVAVITGASSGIGAALARELAASGYRVGLVARRADRLEGLSKELGQRAAIAIADVGVRSQIVAAIHQLSDKLGPVDLLVANAGLGHHTRVEPLNIEEIEQLFRVNVFGVIYSIEAVLPRMLERHSGHVAAVSSVAAYKGMPGEAGYCASKAAVSTFMEGLRIQIRGRGISVTTICPGFVKSEMTAGHRFHMPFLLETEDAARRICRALKRKTKVFNFPWQTTFLMKLSRWLPDALVARLVPMNTDQQGLQV
jgi:short-subunit dehydrogenase